MRCSGASKETRPWTGSRRIIVDRKRSETCGGNGRWAPSSAVAARPGTTAREVHRTVRAISGSSRASPSSRPAPFEQARERRLTFLRCWTFWPAYHCPAHSLEPRPPEVFLGAVTPGTPLPKPAVRTPEKKAKASRKNPCDLALQSHLASSPCKLTLQTCKGLTSGLASGPARGPASRPTNNAARTARRAGEEPAKSATNCLPGAGVFVAEAGSFRWTDGSG